jgi:Subtilase family
MTFHRMWSVLLCLVLNCSPSIAFQTYTYTWNPRTTDVGVEGSKDYLVLKALLFLTKPRRYKVVSGDNLDFIIRKEFLVSETYKHAYALYVRRIIELNKDKHLEAGTVLSIGLELRIPGGPKYGATELKDTALPMSVQNHAFAAMSQKAYELGVATTDKIKTFSTRSLGAYVAHSSATSASDSGQRDSLFQVIKSRGLVRAINTERHPEARLRQAQFLDLTIADPASQAALASLVQSDPTNILPGMFAVSDPKPAKCTPGQPCTSCAKNLGIMPTQDVTRARVLVEDTGVALSAVSPQNLILQSSGDNGQDTSPNSHGTFVYSQIAAPAPQGATSNFGVFPPSSVYVAKVVQTVSGKDYFSMSDIMQAWNAFSMRMDSDTNAAKTRVVNLSAFGEPVPDPNHPPTIPNDGHLLIVAAAGNDGREDEPALWAFDRLANGSTPLLIAGALGTDSSIAGYSNWNAIYVHLFAPGDCVCGAPGQVNGTSQAAPFVTTAAAVLASANPDWDPRSVMWRLISTADHPPGLQGKGFAGIVDLGRALDKSIIVEETVPGGPPKIHHATAISYDANWTTAFKAAGTNVLHKETLRLYSPVAGPQPSETCFASLQMLYMTVTPICVDSASRVEIIENGAPIFLSASQISDVLLPIPGRNSAVLPDINLSTP